MREDGFRWPRDRRAPLPGTEQLIRRGCRRRKQEKWGNTSSRAPHDEQLLLIVLVMIPLARLRAMIGELAEGVGVIRTKPQCISIGGDRLGQIAEFSPRVSQIVKCLGKIRP